ncbi:hypothetical protein E2C01_059164 [Portunus trituberculatus]|uniref:Uncharacterized protein n=1 Tax=Portunus trituberculatus TaxID=210409 RepID=A0A5B7GYE8_PORTR|nr:hypothetical protein [Portunus trituberculatus]
MELIRKLEISVCEEYGMAKQTVSDFNKSKDKLVEYSAKYCEDAPSNMLLFLLTIKCQTVSPLHNMVEEEAVSLNQESYLASLSTLPMKYSHHL